MSTALVTRQPQTIDDPKERKRLLRSLILRGGTEDQIQLLLGICDRYGFDPLLKHVLLVKEQIYVTRDGLRHHAHSTRELDGIEEREAAQDADGKWRVTVAVWRKGYNRPFVATAYQREHENIKSDVWLKAPYRMTSKCAEVAALRMAFDISLGGAEEIGYDEVSPVTNIGRVQVVEVAPAALPNGAGPEQVQAVKEALAAKAAAGGKPPKLSQPMTVERALAIAGNARYSPERRQAAARWVMDQASDAPTIGQYHAAISQALGSEVAEELANARLDVLSPADAPAAEDAPWYDDPTVAPLLDDGGQS